MRYNRENSIFPEGEEPELLDGTGAAREQLAELAERMRRTVLPPALYVTLLMAGGSTETFAFTAELEQGLRSLGAPVQMELVSKKRKVLSRPLREELKPQRHELSLAEKQERLKQQAANDVEKEFIQQFELIDEFELDDLRLVIKRLGEETVRAILTRRYIGDAEVESKVGKPVYKGFENFYYPQEKLQQLIQETLPPVLLQNVTAIYFSKTYIPMLESYGEKISGSGGQVQYEAAHADFYSLEVTIANTPRKQESRGLRYVLAHEFAHVNSPWSAVRDFKHMKPNYLCLNTMAALAKRIGASNMYDSSYVKDIQSDTEEETLQNKMKEYWATIVAAKLNGDVLAPEDELLLAKWFGNLDWKGYSQKFEKLWKKTWQPEDERVQAEWTAKEHLFQQASFLMRSSKF